MSLVFVAAVLSTVHLEGDVTAAGGDYHEVAFTVPAGTVEIQIAHSDGSDFVILDWGAWGPDGFRGWGGGLEDDAIIGVEQSSRGYLPGPITPGEWKVVIGKAKLDATGGHYVLDIECRDNATLTVKPKAAYSPVVLSEERRWYKGDFHVHSNESGDATATFDEIATLARSRGLDFVNISDHNTVSHHALLAAVQPSHADFLFMRGTEMTTYAGHGNTVGTTSYIDHRLGHGGRTIASILEDRSQMGGAFIVNHPVLDLGDACIGCAWKLVDETPWEQVDALELITGPFDIGVNAFVPRVIELWDQHPELAIVGGSDDHRAGTGTGPTASPIGSPTTLVLAENLSEAAIIDAVIAGRTIVQLRGPDDPMVEMTIGAHEIGDTVPDIADVTVTVKVTGGAGMFAQLWRNGIELASKPVESDTSTITFSDEPGDGPHRYRVELVNDLNQRVVVTSHIYVQGIEGGCGCATTSARGSWVLALALLALRRRRR